MLSLFTAGLAQKINLRPTDKNFASLGSLEFSDIISRAITFILVVAAIIFFFMLVIGGIRYITSGGDKAATESARGQITAALIGLVIGA